MTNSSHSSFRRLLLSRLLLLSIPVLLIGVFFTYKKARSALLETARQNITESAVKKGESINQSIEALRTILLTASNTVTLKLGTTIEQQIFVEQLTEQLPTEIQCVQLTDVLSREITASTCGKQTFGRIPVRFWPQQRNQTFLNPSQVYIKSILPGDSVSTTAKYVNLQQRSGQLELLLAVPVYNIEGKIRYVLCVKVALLKPEKVEPGSLTGYPVVINEQGTILAHPVAERVGRNIQQEKDAERLESLVKSALAGQQNFLHLFSFEKKSVELLAGYTSIPDPVTGSQNQRWIIVAFTRLDDALSQLTAIWQVLLFMTFALIAASGLATLYISYELARPLEKLRDYALKEKQMRSTGQIPQDFKIREINQLAVAFNGLVKQLKAWVEKFETAWKEAQTANQLKSEFLATISHELRTPLNGIIGCIRLVRDGYCDDREEEMELLQQADDAAIHLLDVIKDILDISKIEAGKLSLSIQPINLAHSLKEVISLQTVSMQQKGLELKIPQLHSEIIVEADPAKLRQVLINIVGNAVKFTESGSITISTRIESVKREETPNTSDPTLADQMVVVTVKDTGIGIDPAQQHKLFRAFAMVDGSTTRKYGGTGLGLAISRNLMELMGGNVSLSSEGKDKGTTVEIRIPLVKNGNEDHKSSDFSHHYEALSHPQIAATEGL